jgi:hypothetical protein
MKTHGLLQSAWRAGGEFALVEYIAHTDIKHARDHRPVAATLLLHSDPWLLQNGCCSAILRLKMAAAASNRDAV